MPRVETEIVINLYFIIGNIENAKELRGDDLEKARTGFLHALRLFSRLVRESNPELAILLVIDNSSNGVAFACARDPGKHGSHCLDRLFWCVITGGLPVDCYYDLENFYWPFTDTNPPVKAILFYK